MSSSLSIGLSPMRFLTSRLRFQNFTRTLFFTALLILPAISPSYVEAQFGEAFWKHWSDGTAEISSYDSHQLRYNEVREGLVVAIFVTEPFAYSNRVKADPGNHPDTEVFNVLKLNLVEDFPTGIYDYNLMTSTFISVEEFPALPLGSAAKVSFSNQEWCGHSYSQILPGADSVTHEFHSYFDDQADKKESLALPKEWLSEDSLLHWARGLARPFISAGERKSIRLLTSLKETRIQHRPLRFANATLEVAATTTEIEVSAGRFTVRESTVSREDGLQFRFFVEAEFPHRIIKWSVGEDFRAELVATKRVAYWKENSRASASLLEELGLKSRARRTP